MNALVTSLVSRVCMLPCVVFVCSEMNGGKWPTSNSLNTEPSLSVADMMLLCKWRIWADVWASLIRFGSFFPPVGRRDLKK